MTLDRLGAHEAGMQPDSSLRFSSLFGLELAIWEDGEVGLVLQAGHSPARRVTDLRVVVRIDLGERATMELGYRMLSVQFSDRTGPTVHDYVDRMNRSLTRPVVGLAYRF